MKLINDMLPSILPMVVIISVIVITLRVAYLKINKSKYNIYDELFNLIFIIYIICLFHIVSYQDVNYGTNNFVPFKEMFRYDIGTYKFMKNILGNIILFMPYGFFVSRYLKSKKVYVPVFLSILVSSTIEVVQYYIGRTFDIDDIILNVVGGILGFIIFRIFDYIRTKFSKILKGDGLINVIIIVVIIFIILYVLNINVLDLLKR